MTDHDGARSGQLRGCAHRWVTGGARHTPQGVVAAARASAVTQREASCATSHGVSVPGRSLRARSLDLPRPADLRHP